MKTQYAKALLNVKRRQETAEETAEAEAAGAEAPEMDPAAEHQAEDPDCD